MSPTRREKREELQITRPISSARRRRKLYFRLGAGPSQQNTGNKFLFSCFFYTSAALSRRTNMAENSRPPFEHQVRAVATPNANKYNVRIRETTAKREREKCAENK